MRCKGSLSLANICWPFGSLSGLLVHKRKFPVLNRSNLLSRSERLTSTKYLRIDRALILQENKNGVRIASEIEQRIVVTRIQVRTSECRLGVPQQFSDSKWYKQAVFCLLCEN